MKVGYYLDCLFFQIQDFSFSFKSNFSKSESLKSETEKKTHQNIKGKNMYSK